MLPQKTAIHPRAIVPIAAGSSGGSLINSSSLYADNFSILYTCEFFLYEKQKNREPGSRNFSFEEFVNILADTLHNVQKCSICVSDTSVRKSFFLKRIADVSLDIGICLT